MYSAALASYQTLFICSPLYECVCVCVTVCVAVGVGGGRGYVCLYVCLYEIIDLKKQTFTE